MSKPVALPLAVLALALCVWAAIPVAHVSSSQPFEMNGAIMPVGGVPSWPLFVGDVIVTHSAPATVIFRGGSQVILEPNSELNLAGLVVALSTKAAISLDGRNNAGNFAPQTPPNPAVPSPYQ